MIMVSLIKLFYVTVSILQITNCLSADLEERTTAQATSPRHKALAPEAIALFSGNQLHSKIIKMAIGQYSHVSIVVRDCDTQQRYYLDVVSNMDLIVPFFTGKDIPSHLSLRPYDEHSRTYSGEVYERPLIFHEGYNPNPEDFSALIHRLWNNSYTANFKGIIKGIRKQHTEDIPNFMHCSKFVAHILKELRYLPFDFIGENCFAGDFAGTNQLPLQNVQLGEIKVIKRTCSPSPSLTSKAVHFSLTAIIPLLGSWGAYSYFFGN